MRFAKLSVLLTTVVLTASACSLLGPTDSTPQTGVAGMNAADGELRQRVTSAMTQAASELSVSIQANETAFLSRHLDRPCITHGVRHAPVEPLGSYRRLGLGLHLATTGRSCHTGDGTTNGDPGRVLSRADPHAPVPRPPDRHLPAVVRRSRRDLAVGADPDTPELGAADHGDRLPRRVAICPGPSPPRSAGHSGSRATGLVPVGALDRC